MGKSAFAASLALETPPPSVITVHKRYPSKKLDTIVEENPLNHLEAEVTNSFSNMGLNWGNDNAPHSHNSHERYASHYMIYTQ